MVDISLNFTLIKGHIFSYDVLVNNFSTIHQFFNTIDLKITEALEIKKHRPFINVKFNEMSTILNLYLCSDSFLSFLVGVYKQYPLYTVSAL